MSALQTTLAWLSLLDWLAVLFFVLCFRGYDLLVEALWGKRRLSLRQTTHDYRRQWAIELVKRSNRVSDTALIGNLVNSVTFYANTTIYIIAGLFALLGTLDQLLSIAADLPFGKDVSRGVMELKVLLVLGVFVVAYFNFTWSLRQFNLLSILVGSAPEGPPTLPEHMAHIERMAKMNSLAGDDFNRGLRSYYFGIAAVTWMVHPALLLVSCLVVVAVLVRRDFYSEAFRVMQH